MTEADDLIQAHKQVDERDAQDESKELIEDQVIYQDEAIVILASQTDKNLDADLEHAVEEMQGATELAKADYLNEMAAIRSDFTNATKGAVARFLTRQFDRLVDEGAVVDEDK